MKKFIMVSLAGLLSANALAIEPIPQEDGFSGYINLGAGAVRMENNLVAGLLGDEFSDAKASSLTGAPGAETSIMPSVAGELRYTLAASRTQFFAGNLLEDFLRFDMATQLGVRQEVGDAGVIGVALLRSQIPAQVWRDPYVVGVKRKTTDQNAAGYRIVWDKVFGSKLELAYTERDIELDEEWSGLTQLGLPFSAYAQLERSGTTRSLEANYLFRLNSNNVLLPAIRFIDRDLDGKAMASKGYTLLLTHTRTGDRWDLVTNVSWGQAEHDGINPIYLKTDESDQLGVSVSAFYREPFGLKGWRAVLTAAHYNSSADISFYDSEVSLLSAGMLYRF